MMLIFHFVWNDTSNSGSRFKRLCMSVLFQAYKRLPFAKPFHVHLISGLKYIVNPDVPNSTGIIYSKVYESNAIEIARAVLSARHSGIIIDVGAHTGLYSLQIADLSSKIILIEPSKDTARVLQENISINPHLNAEIHQVALGDCIGKATLYKQQKFDGMATLKSLNGVKKGETVDVVTLDSIIFEKTISFLKIDCEGAELEVIKGAKDILKANSEILLHIEITEKFKEVCKVLNDQNFLIYYRTISGKLDLVENEITAHNKNPTFYDTPARGDFWAVKKNANHIISVLSKS